MNFKGWMAGALLALCLTVTVQAEAPVTVPDATPASSLVTPAFKADRFSQAYDRAASRALQNVQANPDAADSYVAPSFSSLFKNVVLSLIVIIGGIYGVLYLLKRYGGTSLLSTAGPIKVLARCPVSNRNTIYLVAALDRFLIIGESSQGLNILSQFEDPEENQLLREKWGWDWNTPREKSSLYAPKASPFGPALKAHVEDLERELSHIQEIRR